MILLRKRIILIHCLIFLGGYFQPSIGNCKGFCYRSVLGFNPIDHPLSASALFLRRTTENTAGKKTSIYSNNPRARAVFKC